jgi:hypothetical protein
VKINLYYLYEYRKQVVEKVKRLFGGSSKIYNEVVDFTNYVM